MNNFNSSKSWQVSAYNELALKEKVDASRRITVADCTLRDGEQHAGNVFTKEEKIKIAMALDELGIHEIEAALPAVSKEDQEAVREIVSLGLKARITALARAMKEDVDLVAGLGVWGVIISLPAGDLQRAYKLKWSDEKYMEVALRMTSYAREKGLHITFSPFDTTRTDLRFLEKVLSRLAKEGSVDRIRLVDTVGSAIPEAVAYLVRQMKDFTGGLPVEIHCHNDFGLAVANTIAAVLAGADVVSTTINGIGERSGNTATEEVVAALRILYGIDLGINLERLYETSRLVEEVSGVCLQEHKPVVGRNSFAHESGLVVAGLLNMPFTAEAYSPEIVGQKRRVLLGKQSGKASVEFKLKELGLSATAEQVNNLLLAVKELATKNKGSGDSLNYSSGEVCITPLMI